MYNLLIIANNKTNDYQDATWPRPLHVPPTCPLSLGMGPGWWECTMAPQSSTVSDPQIWPAVPLVCEWCCPHKRKNLSLRLPWTPPLLLGLLFPLTNKKSNILKGHAMFYFIIYKNSLLNSFFLQIGFISYE